MRKKLFISVTIVALSVFAFSAIAQEQEQAGFAGKFKTFWRKLFNYPARFTQESVDVVADTGKKTVGVLTGEVTRTGEVTSGEFSKTKDLVLEPIKGAADTAKYAAEGIVNAPVKAAKEKGPVSQVK